MKSEIIIGSRESQLALIQTNHIKALLESHFPTTTFSINAMTTTGDLNQTDSLNKIGKSLFTKELEIALKEDRVDFVVHSLKDLPTTLPEGMCLGAITARKDPRDAVIMSKKNEGKTLETLPEKSVVGTSSVRRIAQLKRKYPHLEFKDVRGNLNTRLRKLDNDGVYDALLLAFAGVSRMGWDSRVSQLLDRDVMLHAVGQGALGLECRSSDKEILGLLETLRDYESSCRCLAERQFMRSLEGGCSVPLGVSTLLEGEKLSLVGSVTSLDGTEQLMYESDVLLKGSESENFKQAEELGETVAAKLKEMGATEILERIRSQKDASME